MVELNEYGLTPRDMELFDIMASFNGVTYNPALIKSVYYGTKEQTMRNRLQVLRKKKRLIRYKLTNLLKPKYAILLTQEGKAFVEEAFGVRVSDPNPAPMTIKHLIHEQIVYYWLKKAGRDVERTIVRKWREKGYKHTPDLVYHTKKGLVYVEVELTLKRPHSYIEMFKRVKIDNPSVILYVFENERKMKTIGTKIPLWDKIRYTTIDMLIEGVLNDGKIKAIKQTDYIKQIKEA